MGKLAAAGVVAIVAAVAVVLLGTPQTLQPKQLAGQRMLICGASTGIGRELAMLACSQGAAVVLTSRRAAVLEEIVAECKAAGAKDAHFFAGDVSEVAVARDLVKKSVEWLGGLDMVVLNHIAGYKVQPYLSHLAADPEYINTQTLVNVNLMSYIYIASEALPHLEAARGRLGVVSSAAGMFGLPLVAPYSATKHALAGFFNSLRHDLVVAGSNVSITTSILGFIETPNARANTKGVMDDMAAAPAAECAEAILAGTWHRARQIFYPWGQLYPLSKIHPLCPEWMDIVLRVFAPTGLRQA